MDKQSQGWQESSKSEGSIRDEKMVAISNLAEMTGFPKDFIKKELLLENETEISMESLREKVTKYLIRSQLSC